MCLLYRAGELSVIEYGTNEVLAVCRTEHMSPFLLSVAAVEPRGTASAAKRVAYLVDLQTIRVLDLLSGASTLATVSHDCRIDWLVRVTSRRLAVLQVTSSMHRKLFCPCVS
jgi:intraflagellar transport protein 172